MSRIVVTRARAVILGGGAFAAGTARGLTQTPTPIRVINPPIEAAAQAFYANDMGFFAKAGFVAEIQVMTSGVPAAIASSSFEFGWVTLDALATAHAKGIPLVAIAPGAEILSSMKVNALLVALNSPIQRAKDLAGKTIAINSLQGINESSTFAWIDQNGGDSSTVKAIQMPFPAMSAALDAGRVDVANFSEPFLTAAAKDHRVLGYPFGAIAPDFLESAWATTLQYAKDNPALVSRFAAVMRQTADWANRNLQQSGAILAKYTKIDPAVIATMVRVRYAEQLSAALMQPVIDVSAKYNKFTAFPARELIGNPPGRS